MPLPSPAACCSPRRTRRLVPALLVSAVLAAPACRPAPPEQPTGPTFCDVAPIVSRRCNTCHSSEPQFGAPAPLAQLADFDRPALSDPTREMGELVRERLHDPLRPMPPGGPLSEEERALVDGWLDGGRPSGGCTDVPRNVEFTGSPGLEGLPCEPDVYVTASRVASEPATLAEEGFPVPRWTDAYVCFGVRLPAGAPREAIALTPLVDDSRFVHHMILYLDSENRNITPGPHHCNERSVSAVPLMLWGPGAGGLILPGDVGLTLGEGEIQFELEVHYNNAQRLEDATDRSGFALCTSDAPRPVTAQVGTLGTVGFTIPPRTDAGDGTLELSNRCMPEITEPTRILATAPHMHALGRALKTVVQREDGREEVLVDVQNYDFDNQAAFSVDVTLGPRDRLKTTCRWSNPHDREVEFGGATDDEMCFNFILYYPAGQLRIPGLPADACISAEDLAAQP